MVFSPILALIIMLSILMGSAVSFAASRPPGKRVCHALRRPRGTAHRDRPRFKSRICWMQLADRPGEDMTVQAPRGNDSSIRIGTVYMPKAAATVVAAAVAVAGLAMVWGPLTEGLTSALATFSSSTMTATTPLTTAASDVAAAVVVEEAAEGAAGVLVTATSRATQNNEAFVSFCAGGVGGLCAVLVGHPLDSVKVQMQVNSGQDQSTLDVLQDLLRRHGPLGIYRGVMAPLVFVTPIFAVNFWGYEISQQLVSMWHGLTPALQMMLAGGLSAIPTSLLTAPCERIKCLMQKGEYDNMIDCGRALYQSGGLANVFHGWGATLLRDVPGCTAWFGVYELVRYGWCDTSSLAIMVAGGLAGVVAWALTMPADVLKNRLQSDNEGKYRHIGDVYVELMAREGPMALWQGMGPALLRAFPANAACFWGMQTVKSWLL